MENLEKNRPDANAPIEAEGFAITSIKLVYIVNNIVLSKK